MSKPPDGYICVPVQAAIDLADRYEKSMVIVMSYDPKFELTHFTTYGRSAAEKQTAADAAQRCAKVLCPEGYDKPRTYEDFRQVAPAKQAEAMDLLIRAATGASHGFKSLLAVREGLTDEAITQVVFALDSALAAGKEAQKMREASANE